MIIMAAIDIQRNTAMIDPTIIPTEGMGCSNSTFSEIEKKI